MLIRLPLPTETTDTEKFESLFKKDGRVFKSIGSYFMETLLVAKDSILSVNSEVLPDEDIAVVTIFLRKGTLPTNDNVLAYEFSCLHGGLETAKSFIGYVQRSVAEINDPLMVYITNPSDFNFA